VRAAAALLLVVWAGACASRAAGPPAIAIDRSTCSRCGMFISEPAHAAAIRMPDGTDVLFDDIGCLAAAARALTQDNLAFWFHDAEDGKWIEAGTPVFVMSNSLRTPMGGGIVAYRSRASADRLAQSHGGRVLQSVPELLAVSGVHK
jgi:copper chaperone NosL